MVDYYLPTNLKKWLVSQVSHKSRAPRGHEASPSDAVELYGRKFILAVINLLKWSLEHIPKEVLPSWWKTLHPHCICMNLEVEEPSFEHYDAMPHATLSCIISHKHVALQLASLKVQSTRTCTMVGWIFIHWKVNNRWIIWYLCLTDEFDSIDFF